jgi:hypothetical protein
MIDNTSGIFGISGRVGLLLLPVPKISITVSSSCRFGTGTIDRVYQGGREKSNSAALTALHLGLGYNF